MAQQKWIQLVSTRMWVNPWHCSMGQGSSIAVSYGVGWRCGKDPMLLWLWWRPAAVAWIWPLAWEFPYAVGAALKSKNIKIKINKNNKSNHCQTREWLTNQRFDSEMPALVFPRRCSRLRCSRLRIRHCQQAPQSLLWHRLIPGQGISVGEANK